MIRIIFTDIDGTVLSHSSGHVPETTMEAVHMLREKGIQVWGCTGRHRLELEKLPLNGFEADGWILMNGAYCVQNGRVLYEAPVSQHDIRVLTDALKVNPFPVQFLEKDLMYMNMTDERVIRGLEAIHSKPDPLMDAGRALTHKIYMFIPWTDEENWNAVAEKMEDIQTVRWNHEAADCFSRACGKDRGIEAVLKELHISSEESLAIGDADNDVPMARATGTFCAMGNGTEKAKDAADYVTADIDEGGWAEALKHFGIL